MSYWIPDSFKPGVCGACGHFFSDHEFDSIGFGCPSDEEPTQPGLGPLQVGNWFAPTYEDGQELDRKCKKCRSTYVVAARLPQFNEMRAFCKLCGTSDIL